MVTVMVRSQCHMLVFLLAEWSVQSPCVGINEECFKHKKLKRVINWVSLKYILFPPHCNTVSGTPD